MDEKEAYKAYVTACYASTVVPRILTFEQFVEDPERVAYYQEAVRATQEALEGLG
jgi:hypothetical protein